MRRVTTVRVGTLLLILGGLLSAVAPAQDLSNKKDVLGQARKSYYNLRSEGLSSFQCNIAPNWELLLAKERKQNPEAADAAIKTLNQLQFTTSMAANDHVTLTHNELTGQSQQMMDALKQIYGGMEQMASGFFDTWKLFMTSPPFPETNSQYSLEAVGPQYRLSYKDGGADVVTTMNRDFAITDLKVTTPEFHSTIQPAFTHTSKGWRLSSYVADYESQKPEEATHLDVNIDYQEVEGLSMIRKLSLSGSYGGSPFAVELAFSACQVTKQQATASR